MVRMDGSSWVTSDKALQIIWIWAERYSQQAEQVLYPKFDYDKLIEAEAKQKQ